jgi:hypothetical protein
MFSAVHLAVFLGVSTLAAVPAYYLLRRTDEGRARSAIAYLLGFIVGIVATALLPLADSAAVQAGLLAAFTGPFLGITRAGYMRRRRLRNKARRQVRVHN